MLLISIMNKIQATIKCAFLRDKNDIIINIMRQPKPVSWFWNHYHSLEHAETKK